MNTTAMTQDEVHALLVEEFGHVAADDLLHELNNDLVLDLAGGRTIYNDGNQYTLEAPEED